MTTYVLPVLGLQLESDWSLGRVKFSPGGSLSKDVESRTGQASPDSPRAQLDDWVTQVASEWSDWATASTEASSAEEATISVREALAVLRFFLRELVPVNVDFHKVGLVEEVAHTVRQAVKLGESGGVGLSHQRVAGPVELLIDAKQATAWVGDDRMSFLQTQLSKAIEHRTPLGRRAVTALQVLDSGFLAVEPTIKALFYVMAVEVMFSSAKDGMQKALPIARRVAHLSCPGECATENPSCPFIRGFKNMKAVVDHAVEFSKLDKGWWGCSTFLQVACPDLLVPQVHKTPLFTARNKIAHQGVTDLTEKDVNHVRWRADRALRAGLEWFARHPNSSIDDIDGQIDAALSGGTSAP